MKISGTMTDGPPPVGTHRQRSMPRIAFLGFKHLRRIVRRVPILFRLRMRAGGRQFQRRYPQQDCQLFVTGFPRSGNTFTAEWLRLCWPELRIASHMHTVASLKDARRHGVPTLVLIRCPVDAIASSVVKRMGRWLTMEDTLDAFVADYIEYYEFVRRYRAHFAVVDFKTATQNPSDVVDHIGAALGVMLKCDPSELHNACAVALAIVQADMRRPAGRERRPEKRNFASPEKTMKKTVVTALISSHPDIKTAMKLYTDLVGNAD